MEQRGGRALPLPRRDRRLDAAHRRRRLRDAARRVAGVPRRRSQAVDGQRQRRRRPCAEAGRQLFVLWLDAHADFNTPATSPSGNMHGMPVAFFCGEAEFGADPGGRRPAGGAGRTSMSSASARSIRASGAARRAGVNCLRHARDRRARRLARSCASSSPAGGRRRHAACQPRRRFPRPGGRARRRHDGARRRHLPRGASGHGDAVRQRAGRLARPGRAQSVPRRPRTHARVAAGRAGGQPVRPPHLRPRPAPAAA